MSLVTDLRQGEQWNEELLDELFTPVEVEFAVIKRIPIREGKCHDRWVWQCTGKCNFTVKSAYHIQTSVEQSKASSSSSASMRVSAKIWKGLWNIGFTPKIRNFMWKDLHNKVQVGENLMKRKVQAENIFHLCGELNETIVHVVLRCPFA